MMADLGTYVVQVQCGNGNDFDGRMGLRISSIFVIGFGSFLGALLPVFLARTSKMKVYPLTFFITKYFGSGVIIATAFIHLSAPAHEALNSPCLSGPITAYSWPEGIMLMTIFVMFFIELMASRFEIFGHGHDDDDLEANDPSQDILRQPAADNYKSESDLSARIRESHQLNDLPSQVGSVSPIDEGQSKQAQPTTDLSTSASQVPAREGEITYPPGGEDHLAHSRSHRDDGEAFAAQMTALFILEFGVIFHSIFIGLTLAVAGEEFIVLYIVLVFHQTFEGLGLGSRLATAKWPKKRNWMPWVLGSAYGITTPIAIAAGLGIRKSFAPNSPKTLIINGVFDSISAGILIYTGLVELMAHEFMFNQEMRKANLTVTIGAFGCMCLGAGLMALLGKWA